MSFEGFGEALFDFYDGLAADPSKAYFTDHKQVWTMAVREPMDALVDALEPRFGRAKVFRPYRDVRFSNDKTPYKDHQGAVVETPGAGALYLQVSARGLLVAGGMWQLASDQVKRWRAAVDSSSALEKVLADLDVVPAGEPPSGSPAWSLPEPQLVRVPKPYDAEHPRADLLRCKQAAVSKAYAPAEWMHSPECLDVIADDWAALQPLRDWLAVNVGAPTTEKEGPRLRGRT